MVPAYQTDLVTLWHGDAAAILRTMRAESVDLVATDPPYGAAFNSSYRQERFGEIHNDRACGRSLITDVLRQCVRLVGNRRHLYVFGPTDVLDGIDKVTEATTLVWDKGRTGMGDLSSSWGPAHEPITFTVSRATGRQEASSLPVRMRKGSVLRFSAVTGRNVRHPNEKPVGLMRELIESSSRAGDVVLDPFAGSGSTGVAALLSGRRAVLVESDERWIPLIVARLTAAADIVAMIGAA